MILIKRRAFASCQRWRCRRRRFLKIFFVCGAVGLFVFIIFSSPQRSLVQRPLHHIWHQWSAFYWLHKAMSRRSITSLRRLRYLRCTYVTLRYLRCAYVTLLSLRTHRLRYRNTAAEGKKWSIVVFHGSHLSFNSNLDFGINCFEASFKVVHSLYEWLG